MKDKAGPMSGSGINAILGPLHFRLKVHTLPKEGIVATEIALERKSRSVIVKVCLSAQIRELLGGMVTPPRKDGINKSIHMILS